MKITKVQLQNWCQYEGSHSIDFGTSGDRNVILIHADNDVGKSSLFYSIAWCLHERQPDKWEKKGWPLYPLPWFQRAKIGEQLKTEVVVTFEHAARRFAANRSFLTRKTANGAVVVDSSFLLQRQDPQGNWVNDSEDRLQRIFPKSVIDYFIFDAEKVEHFVNQSESVKQSVVRLLDIEYAERAARHLQAVTSELLKKSESSKDDGTVKLETEIKNLTDALVGLQDELENPQTGAQARLKDAQNQRKLVEEEMYKHREAHALLDTEKRLQASIEATLENQAALLRKLRGLAANLYIPILYPAAEKARQFLEDKRKRGELPKNVKRTFVEDRLRLGQCICGTVLEPGTTAHAEICRFRDTLSDELSDASQIMSNGVTTLREKTFSIRAQLAILVAQLDEAKKSLLSLDQQLKNVKSKIQARDDIPNIPQLQVKKDHLENQELELNRTIGVLKSQIDVKQSELEVKTETLRTIRKKQQQKSETVKQWLFATSGYDVLNRAIGSFKAKARHYLEEQCNEIGKLLFWREDIYTIHIDDNYFISVTSPQYGDIDLLAGMSMGVTQMTGLALIAALAKQTKAEAPLIMDTPFARLSPAHITRALSECPKHFAQWILFLQPSEWRDQECRPVVAQHIQKEYTLRRDNSTGVTYPVEGYHKEFFGKLKD